MVQCYLALQGVGCTACYYKGVYGPVLCSIARSGVVRPTITKVYGPVIFSITRSRLYDLLLQRCMVQCYVALQ